MSVVVRSVGNYFDAVHIIVERHVMVLENAKTQADRASKCAAKPRRHVNIPVRKNVTLLMFVAKLNFANGRYSLRAPASISRRKCGATPRRRVRGIKRRR